MDNLVNNYHFLERFVRSYHPQLVGRRIEEVYAQNQQEYVFLLEESQDDRSLVFYYGHQLSFVFPDRKAKPKTGAKPFFTAINGMMIRDVAVIPYDRSLLVSLERPYDLLFKLYGAHGNVILFEDGKPIETVRKRILNDQQMALETYKQQLAPSLEGFKDALNAGKKSEEAVKQVFPTFTQDFLKALTMRGINEKENPGEKWELIQAFLREISSAPICLHHLSTQDLKDTGLRLSLFQPENAETTFEDPVSAIHEFARRFLKQATVLEYKQKLVSYWQRQIKRHKKRVKTINNTLQKLVNSHDYQQIADVIMANLNSLQKGMTEAKLFDFYHDQWITVPLKQSLTPQANAERLYKKGKNQHLELETAENNLDQEENALALARAEYQQVLDTYDLKTLKQHYNEIYGRPSRQSKQAQVKDKFRHFRIQQYDVYVGKGAAINDLLTFQFANKNDVWLHAKDQKGAHVIIRAGKGTPVPMTVIEAAAQLAAAYAKRKGEALTPVVYTRKKYVWKPRGSDPGKVNYQNESLLMVPPVLPSFDGQQVS